MENERTASRMLSLLELDENMEEESLNLQENLENSDNTYDTACDLFEFIKETAYLHAVPIGEFLTVYDIEQFLKSVPFS